MRSRNAVVILVLALVLVVLVVAFNSFVTIDETEQAVIVRLGKPVHVIVGDRTDAEFAEIEQFVREQSQREGNEIKLSRGAGLYFKTPFVEEVRIMDDRLLEYDSEPREVVTRDKKHLNVDNFARWRILNPLRLLLSAQGEEQQARRRLDALIYSALREELSKANMVEIVRSSNDLIEQYPDRDLEEIRFGRSAIMKAVTEAVNEELGKFGIHVLDVRIKRADLLEQNERAVFDRMRAERSRISTQYRAEGMREKQKIEAETDRQVRVLLAEAERQAEVLIGAGEAEAASIYAAAYEPHRDFYVFLRSLTALEQSMDEKTRLVIGTRSPLFRYLKDVFPDGDGAATPSRD